MAKRTVSSPQFDPNRVPWNQIWTVVPWAVALLIVASLLMSSVYTVEAHERAVVMRFGKFQSTQPPGLHFRIPWVDEVLLVSMEEHGLRLPFGTGPERPVGVMGEEPTLMMTGDLKSASVEWTIQWHVIEPDKYQFRFDRPNEIPYVEQVITTAAQTVMNRLVGDYSLDEVLTESRRRVGRGGPASYAGDSGPLRLRDKHPRPANAACATARGREAGFRQGEYRHPGSRPLGERSQQGAQPDFAGRLCPQGPPDPRSGRRCRSAACRSHR